MKRQCKPGAVAIRTSTRSFFRVILFVAIAAGLTWITLFESCENESNSEASLTEKVLLELTSHYPSPINASADGTMVLVRSRPESDSVEGLAVIETSTGKTVRSLQWPEQMTHTLWRDGRSVSFFSQNPVTNARRLILWDVVEGRTRDIPIPLTFNQPNAIWSPDGSRLAFNRDGNELVLVTVAEAKGPTEYAGKITTFAWSDDSRRIAVVPDDNSRHILVIDAASGNVVRVITPMALGRIMDVTWQPGRSMIVLIKNEESSSLIKVRGEHQESLLITSKADIRSPAWLSARRGYVFRSSDSGGGDLLIGQEHGKPSPRKLPLTGIDFRGSLPGGRAIIVMHRADGPPELLRVPLDGGKQTVLAASHSSLLPKVVPQQVQVDSFDGLKVPILVWRSPFRKEKYPTAVIRVHSSLHGAETPAWQADIQMYLKSGADFIGINYRGSSGYGSVYESLGNDAERGRDILAACEYTHAKLGVPYSRIVVLGHSTGAMLALGAALIRPDRMGLLVLVSLPALPRLGQTLLAPRRDSLYVLALHGGNDRILAPTVAKELIERTLGPNSLTPNGRHWRVLPGEDHVLHLERSWALVHSVLLRTVGLE